MNLTNYSRIFSCELYKYHIILRHSTYSAGQSSKAMVGQNTLIDTLPLMLLSIDNMIIYDRRILETLVFSPKIFLHFWKMFEGFDISDMYNIPMMLSSSIIFALQFASSISHLGTTRLLLFDSNSNWASANSKGFFKWNVVSQFWTSNGNHRNLIGHQTPDSNSDDFSQLHCGVLVWKLKLTNNARNSYQTNKYYYSFIY